MTTAITGTDPTPADLVSVTLGGFRWHVPGAYRGLLLGPAGLRLPEWLADGSALAIKRGPHRAVYRVDLPGLSFHLKHNLVHNTRAWLRQLVRPSKAATEYQRAAEIAARGVSTVRPIGFGEKIDRLVPGESYLLTQTLGDTTQLNYFIEVILPGLPPARRAVLRQRLAAALGAFIADAHAAGVLHHDLHCGNILVRTGPEERVELFLIDLHAARLGPRLTWGQCRANLLVLNRWLAARTSRADRLRFWAAYHDRRGAAGRHEPATAGPHCRVAAARRLEADSHADGLRFWSRRDRRCLHVNRRFTRIRTGSLRGHAVTDLDRAALLALLAHPDAPFGGDGTTVLKKSRSGQVVEFTLAVQGEQRRVIYKRFEVTEGKDPYLHMLRPSPALRSWQSGHALRERGLPTARPLAVFHRVAGGLAHEGYLLTEKVESRGDLLDLLDNLQEEPPPRRLIHLRKHIDELALLIRELHHRKLAHRDLKAQNILVRDHGETPEDRSRQVEANEPTVAVRGPFCLIDLVGISRPGRLGRRRRAKNLARLNASFWDDLRITRTDRLRFLRTYMQWGLHGKESWKKWWRDIEQATLAKVKRNARKGRPLT